jgi:hypothetical protein
LPELEAVRAEWEPKGVGFLALSLHPDVDDVKEAVAKIGIRMPVALADGPVLAELGAAGIPATVFVSHDGRIVAVANGERSRRFFARRVEALVEHRDLATKAR